MEIKKGKRKRERRARKRKRGKRKEEREGAGQVRDESFIVGATERRGRE